MKFARYLSDNLVPEWRTQYLDYKGGKKRLKKLRKGGGVKGPLPELGLATPSVSTASKLRTSADGKEDAASGSTVADGLQVPSQDVQVENISRVTPQQLLNASGAIDIPGRRQDSMGHETPNLAIYGSIIATPPTGSAFHLPPPALAHPDDQQPSSSQPIEDTPILTRTVTFSTDANADQKGASPGLGAPALSPQDSVASLSHRPTRSSMRGTDSARNPLSRQSTNVSFKSGPTASTPRSEKSILKQNSKYDMGLPDTAGTQRAPTTRRSSTVNAVRSFLEETRRRMSAESDYRDFISWLDGEFDKVQTFYRMKEQEAVVRFDKIKDQLHVLRDQKMQERDRTVNEETANGGTVKSNGKQKPVTWADQIARNWKSFYKQLDLHHLPFFSKQHQPEPDGLSDYRRREAVTSVPYNAARKKLKYAVVEYYRGLELLKSYHLLNRTAVQKITKKFDKVTQSSISPWYLEKVNRSYFGQSDVVDNLINQVEDFYSRYFERGNRKQAIEKLRRREQPASQYSATFLSGIWIGIGLPLFIQALVTGLEKGFRGEIPNVVYIFQIFGGGFLMCLFGVLFTINCMAWSRYKINYPFIFEWDQRHFLNFREFLEIPSFLFFFLSICMYLCFYDYWPNRLPAQWYPLIFVVGAVLVLFLPLPIFHWRAREWLAIALWRLMLSGLYPVEFRDFFLGDIFCSLTYSLSNAELFFCLYARDWNQAPNCGSSRSRVMGFLNALPPIWRFLQCWRRYFDTKNWFPHLANAGKYTFTIATAVVLSVWRIDRVSTNRDVFVLFASINTVYSTFWDLFMDWSLFQPNSRFPLLRDELGFHTPWFYYCAMVIDVLLRLDWIFYVIFPVQVQQSAALSFMIALLEVVRRFVWIFFRMENEHCTNVGRFIASRDMPLPYDLEEVNLELDEIETRTPLLAAEEGRSTGAQVGVDQSPLQPPRPSPLGSVRRRKSVPLTPRLVANAIRDAHAQDFERRKPDRSVSHPSHHGSMVHPGDFSDDDDDDGDDDNVTVDDGDDDASAASSDQDLESEADLGSTLHSQTQAGSPVIRRQG
ncbi:EXS family protein [Lipomyces kononenkoae]|uniref:EXS family protein n=1 Tax=Lipomyces kononenkoae TaxID=34357 RepID=A0ACC3T4A5_LIPKO